MERTFDETSRNRMNQSYCMEIQSQEGNETDNSDSWCLTNWDKIMCWPKTQGGHTAVQSCFEELKSILYDNRGNATKYCYENGTWSKSNYSLCGVPLNITNTLPDELDNSQSEINLRVRIYLIGYSISLLSLIVASGVLMYFKDLRNRRNYIHINLMWTYMLTIIVYIIIYSIDPTNFDSEGIPQCFVLLFLIYYFQLTNYFWMFIEGLYLFLLVIKPFSVEKFTLKLSMLIGWAIPLIVMTTWALMKYFAKDIVSATKQGNSHQQQYLGQCEWLNVDHIDWIYQGPAIFVLCLNLIFLFVVIRVLLIKLRTTNGEETQQYWKAAKALLVLAPLLGVTYIVLLLGLDDQSAFAKTYEIIRTALFSSQGLFVSFIYCFLNSEVRRTMQHQNFRRRDRRSIGRSRRILQETQNATETVRLYGRFSLRTTNTELSSNNSEANKKRLVRAATTAVFSDSHIKANPTKIIFGRRKWSSSKSCVQEKVIHDSKSFDADGDVKDAKNVH